MFADTVRKNYTTHLEIHILYHYQIYYDYTMNVFSIAGDDKSLFIGFYLGVALYHSEHNVNK